MMLDVVKQLDICKDLSQALAYLHAQVSLCVLACTHVSTHVSLCVPPTCMHR